MFARIARLAVVLGLAGGAGCAGDLDADSPTAPTTTTRVCAPSADALDVLDHELVRCTDDAGCPCGSRCAPVGVCTYDCRVDRADQGCGAARTCDAAGRCVAEDAEVAP